MQIDVLQTLSDLYASSGIAQFVANPLALVMVGIACLLMYLAIVKQFEPLLLLPIAFGMLLTNLLGSDIFHEELFAGGHVNWGLFGGALLVDGNNLLDQAVYVVNAAGQVLNSVSGQIIGHFTSAVSVEATTLGLGYLVPPTQVEIYDGEPAAYVVKRFFDRCGITFDYKGTLDEGFYLARINRENLVPDYHIPENLLRYLEEDGASETGIWYTDSLGEFDFYGKSGWNIAVDEFYPNSGLSGVHLNDGQRLAIRFTLHLGYDIGGLNGADGEYPEKFIESY